MTLHDVSAVARGETPDPAYREELARWWQRISEDRLGTIEGVDATDLSQAGWGVVFPRGADPGIREALGDLLVHRREQASRRDGRYYREFSGETAYRAGES